MSNVETYAGVCALEHIRLITTHACSQGMSMISFDLNTAFLNARINPDDPAIIVSLPPEMKLETDGTSSPLRRLERCLYGLKQSPASWRNLFDAEIRKMGWTESQFMGSCYRKVHEDSSVSLLILYVDDVLLFSGSDDQCSVLANQILNRFEGRVIKPGKVLVENESGSFMSNSYDVLGMALTYCPINRACTFDMQAYIKKTLVKFHLSGHKDTPHLPLLKESDILSDEENAKPVEFPVREALGSLNCIGVFE
jgi:hypothetical protein